MFIHLFVHRLAELVEAEAENYLKVDPDPFDERHPSRADPNCSFGQMLKVLFRKDTFMNKVMLYYIEFRFIRVGTFYLLCNVDSVGE